MDNIKNGVRRRGRPGSSFLSQGLIGRFRGTNNGGRYNTLSSSSSSPLLSEKYIFCILALLFLIGLGVVVVERRLPVPLMLDQVASYPDRFIAERAMGHLIELTKLGPRVVGSDENEVHAIALLVGRIQTFSKRADTLQSGHKIEWDVQQASGAFPLSFLDGMTNVYRNVQNIVVRISPRNQPSSGHSLLINCHHDTVPDSPGASDDGASCAIMLEMLQLFSERKQPLRHDIIMLFNGAEENLMQASHGFITQHRWAKEIRSFVNLEACGAGGREILFQVGPNHPWMIRIYANNVPYPYTTSLAQEIFESKVVPGDTDYRIFRDFGKIPGLDFAWSSNGYVYHTKFDDVNHVPLGTLQRTGDNIYALVLGIANSPELAETDKHAAGNLVFFDFVGAFVIYYVEPVALFLNCTATLVTFWMIWKHMCQAKQRYEITFPTYCGQLIRAGGILWIGWISSIVVCLVIGLLVTCLGRSMSWFGRPIWLVFLYVLPMAGVSLACITFGSRGQKKVLRSPWIVMQIYLDAYSIMWASLLIVCIFFKIRSGLVPLYWLSFPIFGEFLKDNISYFSGGAGQPTPLRWLIAHILILILPLIQSFYLHFSALQLFIPIMGRNGSGNHSEIAMALASTIGFKLSIVFLLPLIIIVRKPGKVLKFLLSVFLISLGLIVFTPLGFPYSGDPLAPSPQRYMLAHTQRNIHRGSSVQTDSGFWIVNMDQHSPHSVNTLVPEMKEAIDVSSECEKHVFCGMPYPFPVLNFIWQTHWVKSEPPNIPIPINLQVQTNDIGNSTRRFNFNITGPDHLALMISPASGTSFAGWTIADSDPMQCALFQGRPLYFVYYGIAQDSFLPWTFSIDIKRISKSTNQSKDSAEWLDFAVVGHYFHGENKMGSALKKLVNQFPPWTAVTSWTSIYNSWQF